MNLLQIAESWANFFNGDKQTQELMAYRLNKCDKCPHKVQMSKLGQKIITSINSEASTYKCGLCHCPLAGLTARPANACKDNRWGPAGTESMY